MTNNTDITTLLQSFLYNNSCLVQLNERSNKMKKDGKYNNFLYLDKVRVINVNTYLQAYLEKRQMTIDAKDKTEIENITHRLIEQIKKYNTHTVEEYYYADSEATLKTIKKPLLNNFEYTTDAPDNLGSPGFVCQDSNNDIYVSEDSKHRIAKFSEDGTFLLTWGSNGNGNGEFVHPTGVCCDSDDKVYVCDSTNNRIQVFQPDGTYILQFGTSGSGNGQLNSPYGIYIDLTTNYKYVAELGNHRIQVFDENNTYVTKWGSDGTDDGKFKTLFDCSVFGDHVYVIEYGAPRRVQKFLKDGTFVSSFATGGINTNGIDLDQFGYIYVSVRNDNRIMVFRPDGTLERYINFTANGFGIWVNRTQDTLKALYNNELHSFYCAEFAYQTEHTEVYVNPTHAILYEKQTFTGIWGIRFTWTSNGLGNVITIDSNGRKLKDFTIVDNGDGTYYSDIPLLDIEDVILYKTTSGNINVSLVKVIPLYTFIYPDKLVNAKIYMVQEDVPNYKRSMRILDLEIEKMGV
jgi:DNA-binding beta-propeller fold protein YncE